MSGAKEIRNKIGSVKSTQKITRAMELVAASKMRKAQDRMSASKPYAQKIRQVIGHLARANTKYEHAFLTERAVERVGIIVVSTDRGLCGGLNINLFKQAISLSKAYKDQGIETDFCLIGAKAASFFKSVGGNVLAAVSGLGDIPQLKDIIGAVKSMLEQFEEGHLDRVYLVSNEFVNTMSQKPVYQQLLPVGSVSDERSDKSADETQAHSWDYIYEPDSSALIDALVMRFIESQVYQGVVENNACEQAARMVAMKSATDNAGNMIKELQLVYNKARQASITQELAEIVGGASAV